MLTALRIGNFKAFAESQRIPIRPLTLIYGANSSGKSSVLHSLLFTHHASGTGSLDIHLTKIGGDAVDLGGFKQFVYNRNSESNVDLEWELSSEGFFSRLKELLPEVDTATIGLSFGLSGYDKELIEKMGSVTPRQLIAWFIQDAKEKGDQKEVERLQSTLAESEDKLTLEEISRLKSELRVKNFWIKVNNKELLSTSLRPDGRLQLDTLDNTHKIIEYLIENLILNYSTADYIDRQEVLGMADTINELVPKISLKVFKLFPEKLVSSDALAVQPRSFSLVTVRKESRLEDLKNVVKTYLPGVIEEITLGLCSEVMKEIEKLIYLGPLRVYPPRHMGMSETNDPNWNAGGGSAWDLVRKDLRLRRKINDWLTDEKKLSTSFELRVRNLVTIESIKAKLSELAVKAVTEVWENAFEPDGEGVLGDPLGDIEEALEEVPDKLKKMETLFSDVHELVMYDKRSKTMVSHRDVGIGISQALPVLVYAFASEEKLFAIEQPEIHLHPALQADLGDVFIHSALGEGKNRFLIETHSEHLLLRIMRRMRQTSSGELPEGVPPITPKDVCVLFVQPKGTASVVRHLELDEEGQLLDAWPGGFFEEGFRERFS